MANRLLYILGTYGLVRSAYIIHAAEIDVYNYKSNEYETRPLFITERIGGLAAGTVIFACLAPMCILADIHNFESHCRGRYNLENRDASRRRSVLAHMYGSIID